MQRLQHNDSETNIPTKQKNLKIWSQEKIAIVSPLLPAVKGLNIILNLRAGPMPKRLYALGVLPQLVVRGGKRFDNDPVPVGTNLLSVV